MHIFSLSNSARRNAMSSHERLSQRLERLRKAQGLTAKAMAQLIEVPESTYREWEHGRGLKLPPFQKISQVLSISVTELVCGEISPNDDLIKDLTEAEEGLRRLRLKWTSRF